MDNTKDQENQVIDLVFSSFELEDLHQAEDKPDFHLLRDLLISRISQLLDSDLEKLLWILYRIDISEMKARDIIAGFPDEEPAVLLADMILERQLEKIRSRQNFKINDEPTDPEEEELRM